MSLSTHVLYAVTGTPAVGVAVTLRDTEGTPMRHGYTDDDGRIATIAAELDPGVYTLSFDTGAWFAANHIEAFYPRIDITFTVTDPDRHYHVPVLLSPFAFSTYRGS